MKATVFDGRLSDNQTILKVINHLELLADSADTAKVIQADGPTNYVLIFNEPPAGSSGNWSAEPIAEGLNSSVGRKKVEDFLDTLKQQQLRSAKIVASQGHPAFVIYRKV